MHLIKLCALIGTFAIARTTLAQGVVCSLQLSPTDPAPGALVTWTLIIEDSTPGFLGLAGFSVDLVQSASNPAPVALSSAPVPVSMSGFSRPGGISNPLPSGTGTAFGGTPMPASGVPQGLDLIEIGGMQNTFGVAIGSFGSDLIVESGVARQPGGQVAGVGTFSAPALPGQYCFELTNGLANVLWVMTS